jgi:prepilin-type N-terminal cleavage/methylation domain-containing protein
MKKPSIQRGFSLVEVAVALGIVSLILTALLGGIAAASRSTSASSNSQLAATLADEILATLKNDPAARNTMDDFPIPALSANITTTVSANLTINGAGRETTSPRDAAFKLSYTIVPEPNAPTDSPLSKIRYVTLDLKWPPQAAAKSQSMHRITTAVLLP